MIGVEEFIKKWKDVRYRIPQSAEIVKEIIRKMEEDGKLRPDDLKRNFDRLVEELQITVYERYLEHEKRMAGKFFRDYFSSFAKDGADAVVDAVAGHFKHLDALYLSLSQSRRTRAGKAFEDILKELFARLGYPFAEKPIINGIPDFLLPSEEYYRRNAMDCIIFTSKRTLRERWRQIVTEGTRGLGFFLATIDEGVSGKALEEMKEHRIYIVVPERIKKEFYPDAENAISFRDFFFDHLDPKMASWRRKHVVP